MSGLRGGQHAGFPHSPCPKSLADMGMRMSLEAAESVIGWSSGLQAGGRGVPTHQHHILDPVLCCPPLGVPLFHPSRVRQLEEELRTMDQSLKSLIASEEEVLGQGCGAMCSSPLSLSLSLEPCEPPLSFLHHCLHHQRPLSSLSSRLQAGHAPSSLHPCFPLVGPARAWLVVMHEISVQGSTRNG